MKIGLMAYHYACNFGATLQLLSTYMYLKNHGHTPLIINYVAPDLKEFYAKTAPAAQIEMLTALRKTIWHESALCSNDNDIARVIDDEGVDAVIIGSDAVTQHHPLRERIVFPCKRIIAIRKNTSNLEFPNPLWGTWMDCLKKDIPMAVMSASSQDSKYKLIPKSTRKEMRKYVSRYSYLSVRDEWTRDMFAYITDGDIVPDVTPDPVFAFNQNAGALCPTKEDITARFNLPGHYILLSFTNKPKLASVDQTWLDDFAKLAAADGKECISLPFATGKSLGKLRREIALPLSPIDWYALIKYSDGYVGNNMHPIVVCLHNAVRFFSFDNYGTTRLNSFLSDDSSSKIKHILTMADQAGYRVSAIARGYRAPAASDVYARLAAFNTAKSKAFAAKYLELYNRMMDDILAKLS